MGGAGAERASSASGGEGGVEGSGVSPERIASWGIIKVNISPFVCNYLVTIL